MTMGLLALDIASTEHEFAWEYGEQRERGKVNNSPEELRKFFQTRRERGECQLVVHDPHARAFRDRLVAKGKKKMQALVAVMRKMLTAAWSLFRNPARYDGAKLYQLRPEA